MSLIGTLNLGYLGLMSQQRQVDTVSHNVANARTVGFKQGETLFHTLMASPTAPSGAATGGVSYGVVAQRRFLNERQGEIAPTDQTTEMALNGKGMFVVRDPVETPGGPARYTRDGSFGMNAAGKLANSAGMIMQGWALAENAPFNPDQVTSGALTDVEIGFDIHKKATTTIDIAGPLSSNQTLLPGGPGESDYAATLGPDITIYDSEGQGYTLSLGLARQAEVPASTTGPRASTWGVYVAGLTRATTGEAVPGSPKNNDPSTWTSAGTFGFSGGLLSGTSQQPGAADGTELTLTLDLSPYDISGFTPEGVADAGTPAWGAGGKLSLGIGTAGEYTDSLREENTGSPSQLSLRHQDGFPRSGLDHVEVSDEGVVTSIFRSGASVKTWQVAIASFSNYSGLSSESGTVFAETPDSGSAVLGRPDGTEGRASVQSMALEQSTADITDQFTRMIQAQRIYSAASKVVTTADSMWTTAIQLKA